MPGVYTQRVTPSPLHRHLGVLVETVSPAGTRRRIPVVSADAPPTLARPTCIVRVVPGMTATPFGVETVAARVAGLSMSTVQRIGSEKQLVPDLGTRLPFKSENVLQPAVPLIRQVSSRPRTNCRRVKSGCHATLRSAVRAPTATGRSEVQRKIWAESRWQVQPSPQSLT